jgi:hypothetical protein
MNKENVIQQLILSFHNVIEQMTVLLINDFFSRGIKCNREKKEALQNDIQPEFVFYKKLIEEYNIWLQIESVINIIHEKKAINMGNNIIYHLMEETKKQVAI